MIEKVVGVGDGRGVRGAQAQRVPGDGRNRSAKGSKLILFFRGAWQAVRMAT
jgi:hypothetical protein